MNKCTHIFINHPIEVNEIVEVPICIICYMTKAEADLQSLRQRLKEIEYTIDGYWNEHGEKAMRSVCSVCRELYEIGHKEGCWLKAELDKLEVVE